MVQGGFNVVLNPEDSYEKHLKDTLKGGQFINDQEMARTLVEEATPTIKEMETIYGCFFDRNPDGTIHQKPFAGQSFDRTVHKGDLTGIEIISRTTEQIMKRNIPVLEEHRALDLLMSPSGERVAGALLLDMRRGTFVVAEASVTGSLNQNVIVESPLAPSAEIVTGAKLSILTITVPGVPSVLSLSYGVRRNRTRFNT